MAGYRAIALGALAVLPLCAIPGWLFRDSWELTAVLAACLAVCAWMTSWWFRLFLLAASGVLVRYPTQPSLCGMMFILIFLGAAEIYAASSPAHIMSMIRIAGLSMAAVVALQLTGIIPQYSGRPTGLFNPDAAGVFFALCFPAFLEGRARYLAPIVAGGAILAGSTTGFASLSAGFGVFAAIRWRRACLYVFSGMAALCGLWTLLLDPAWETVHCVRWTAWKHILMAFRSEMWGRGIGSFKETFNYFIMGVPAPDFPRNWTCAHNEYLQAGYELGVQAIILIAGFLGVFAWRTWRYRRRMTAEEAQIAAGVASVGVSCMGWFTFHIAPLALVSLAWISLWVAGQKSGFRCQVSGKKRMRT